MKKSIEEIEAIAVDLVPANLNPKVMIKKVDAFNYHIACEKRAVDPGNPTMPIIKKRILILEPANYNRYFGPQVSEAQKIENLKTMAIYAPQLIHDPTKNSEKLNEEIVELKAAFVPDPYLVRKALERPAKMADLEKFK